MMFYMLYKFDSLTKEEKHNTQIYSLLKKIPNERRALFMFCKDSLNLKYQIYNFHIGFNVTGSSKYRLQDL